MISGIILKILSITLLILVGIVLILGIGTLFKGGEIFRAVRTGQAQMGASVKYDQSGNALNEDVGLWLKSMITNHFAHERYDSDEDFAGKKAKCFLVDPTYAIRAVPANAYDQVYCSSLAHAAVHGAMAGYTRFLVGNINTRLAMLPLDLVVNRRHIVAIRDRMWTRLLFSTGQPPSAAACAASSACSSFALMSCVVRSCTSALSSSTRSTTCTRLASSTATPSPNGP